MPRRDLPAPVRRGDRLRLAVDALGDGPDALAHIDSYVVLLPGAIPGEEVRAEITSAARKFGRARLLGVERRSPERTEPRCRHFLACGGCHWQHIDYAAQLEHKRQRVHKELAYALADKAPPVEPCRPAAAPYGQRHKVALHALPDRRLGIAPALHALRELDLVPIDECPSAADRPLRLAQGAMRLLARAGVAAWDPVRDWGLLRSVLVRTAISTGQSHLIVVARDDRLDLEPMVHELMAMGATTISLNCNDGDESRLLGRHTRVLAGPERIDERLHDTHYCISPTAFFQTSPAAAAELVTIVEQFLRPGSADIVADLYCGGGLFALPLSLRAREVVGIEESPVSIADAEAGARRNRSRNVRFVRGAVEAAAARLGRDLPRPSLVVLDPPREGCAPQALQHVAALRPARIAYVACDPRALARDLHALAALGYAARSVVPVDMFPQTWHVEAVALLEPLADGAAR